MSIEKTMQETGIKVYWKHCNRRIYKKRPYGDNRTLATQEDKSFFCPFCGEILNHEHYRVNIQGIEVR